MDHQLLREFIRENLGAMFGLDRHVTMNALGDTISGPHPVDALAVQAEPVTSYDNLRSMDLEAPSVVDHLSPIEEKDDEDPSDIDL